MPFRFAAKYGLLTYAQCGDLDPWKVSNHLSGLGAECIVGRESHADGGIHLHVFFMFNKIFQSRNERIFDVDGRHPNIEKGRGTPEIGWDYATKDGDICAGGLERPPDSPASKKEQELADVAALHDCQTKDEFYEAARQVYGRRFFTSFTSLRTYADWKFRPVKEEYVHPPDITFDVDDIVGTNTDAFLADWWETNVRNFNGSGWLSFSFCCSTASGLTDFTLTLTAKSPGPG